MIEAVTRENFARFRRACTYVRIFGAKCLCTYQCFGTLDADPTFWLGTVAGRPACAMMLCGGVLTCSSDGTLPPAELAAFLPAHGVTELDADLAACQAVQRLLGGTMESSWMMYYGEKACAEPTIPILPCQTLSDAFSVLQQSHVFYQTHYQFEPWAQDLRRRISCATAEVYTVTLDGRCVGTGSISAMDDAVGVLAAIAVLPEYRHRGIGSELTRFLTRRVLALGKQPCLISGYDEVAALYRALGYTADGRWGELYL